MHAPMNRIVRILDAMQNETDDQRKLRKPKSEFAVRFTNRLKECGLTAQTLADAINTTGQFDKEITESHIRNFMKSSVEDLANMRNTPLLKACADLMKCSVKWLFGEDDPPSVPVASPQKPMTDPSDPHAMLDVALNGPKSGFIKEALQFAFTQAILAKNHL